MPRLANITPCLWFDNQAEEAAKFYCGIFPNAKTTDTTHYSEVGNEIHGMRAGAVLTVEFELDGHPFTALNGGPLFKFSEAISFQINCETQADVDHFWNRLLEDMPADSGRCGWLKDKFGVSWQVVPTMLPRVLFGPDKAGRERAMKAMLQMKKLDIARLQEAYNG
jgi:predicted 3-demethylubiquinone-9 3-methyltransferase (glyoxalase superfamily)